MNILNEENNTIVLDMSEFDLDLDFLMILAFEMKTLKNCMIGQVILGEKNQIICSNSEYWPQISKCVVENNLNYQRYPSDLVHCMLASYCRLPGDDQVWTRLENLGWVIENELKISDQDYSSILFKNKSTRQLVLAFRGITFDFNECYSFSLQDENFWNKTSQKLISHCYYSYLHSKLAFELSQINNFFLSFTGHAYGAWLAEMSLFYCSQWERKSPNPSRAVTFDSPGSGYIFRQIDESDDFNELDIITYLSCPNFINTSSIQNDSLNDDNNTFADYNVPSNHIGTVYFMNDVYTKNSDTVKSVI